MARIVAVLTLTLLLAVAAPVFAGHGGGELLGTREGRGQQQ